MDYKTLYVNLLLKHGSEEKPKDYAEHGIAHYNISRFCKSDRYPGFYYE